MERCLADDDVAERRRSISWSRKREVKIEAGKKYRFRGERDVTFGDGRVTEKQSRPTSPFEDRIITRAGGLGFIPEMDAPLMNLFAPCIVWNALRRLRAVGAIYAERDELGRTVYRSDLERERDETDEAIR